ncbi:class I SAM-dependent methyltransferase [Vibrio coralliilyticus]|uniref:Class I SAM-dependent methyltransferase n=2 Tax=Vibrio coralliilyticus TaxID=190893 RepID=A0AAP7DDM8_9VIBR|nr:class I SAM-dependent methyltransferase [Vibrio coralliilyticus]
MYTQYPYPSNNVGDAPIYDLAAMVSAVFGPEALEGKTVVDLGCGSGHRLCGLAELFPNTRFIGVDMTDASLEVAGQLAATHEIHNVAFVRSTIEEFELSQPCDLIVSTGVFHHMDTPLEGFKSAYRNLAEGGVALIWLYHEIGERDRLLQREALQTLLKAKSPDSWYLNVEDMALFGASLSTAQYGGSASHSNGSANQLSIDVDAFLHPIVNAYSFAGIGEMVNQAGFSSLRCCGFNRADSSRLFSSDISQYESEHFLTYKDLLLHEAFKKTFLGLPYAQQVRVAELMWKPTGLTVLCQKGVSNTFTLPDWLGGEA